MRTDPRTGAWTTGRIAAITGARCEGPEDRAITRVGSLQNAGPEDLTFCSGGPWKAELSSTRAGAVLVSDGLDVPEGVVALRHAHPRHAYAVVAAEMLPLEWPAPGVHPLASVDPTAVVDGATIGPFAVVEAGARVGAGTWVMAHAYVGQNATIGQRCRLQPHAVVMERCVLGDRVWLHPGAVIGGDGFGHVPTPDGPVRVPQLGTTVLGDDVEVGSNACVDRAALDETRVGNGTRLDNLVQVAHGVHIGKSCLLAAFAGVAGGAKLGDGVIMAGRTAVIDGIEVGDGAVFAGLASASKDVPKGARLGGSPARRYAQWLREVAAVRHLPEWGRTLERLARRVEALERGEDT